MAERFNQRVQIAPGDLSTGRGQALLTLSDKLNEFSQIGFAETAKRVSAQGVAKAQSVELTKDNGITQSPEFRKEGFIGGVESQAYNKALMASYVASVNSDIKTGISKIRSETPDDVILFNDKIEGFKKGVLDGVDPSLRQDAQIAIDDSSNMARIQVQAAQTEKQRNIMKGELSSSLDTAANQAFTDMYDGNPFAARKNIEEAKLIVDQMVKGGFLSRDAGNNQLREIEREATEQGKRKTLSDIADISIERAEETLNKWESDLPKGWTPDEWKTYIKTERTELKYRRAILENADARRSDITKNELLNKAAEGNLTLFDVTSGFFDDGDDRKEWFSFAQSQSKLGQTAIKEKENRDRRIKLDLEHDEDRQKKLAAAKISDQAKEEEKIAKQSERELDTLYRDLELTQDMIKNSNATPSVKRSYEKMLKQRNKIANEEVKKLEVSLARNEILMNLGNFEDEDLNAYIGRGLEAKEILQWKKENKATKEDPTNYRNDMVFKQGYQDLLHAKQNNLFVGGGETTDLSKDNKNTQLYLQAVEEYVKRSSTEDANFIEILEEIKKPFIDQASKGLLRKLYEGAMKRVGGNPNMGGTAPQSAIDYLKKNPEFKDQFKAKYGYLPEGK